MIGRRRFIQILAATAVFGARPAQAAEWRGVALGADVSISLTGPGADRMLSDLPALLDRLDATFSLYRASELTKLNATGAAKLSPWMREALALCEALHTLTDGAFDPTVQPLWQARATGGDVVAARAAIGWRRVTLTPDHVRLAPGQALTLNGMAQGFAADVVRAWLAAAGYTQALVNVGEYAALGGPFALGISDPAAGQIGEIKLAPGHALAASSPRATLVAGEPHIVHPRGRPPLWSTVAVETQDAAMADGLSTALVFLTRDEIKALAAQLPALKRVTLIDDQGDLSDL
jgi:thiamine biosynthesis lipoprotein